MSDNLTGHMSAIAVPGFADTADYWTSSLPASVGKMSALTWAGLWGAGASETPISDAIQWVSNHSTSESILIGHSLGCRILLHALPQICFSRMILIAPALGEYSFLEPVKLSEWERSDVRETFRLHPVTGEPTVLHVPYSYADEILALPVCPRIPAAVTVILLSEDTRQNVLTRQQVSSEGTIVEVDGPHRWWENKTTRENIQYAISHALER